MSRGRGDELFQIIDALDKAYSAYEEEKHGELIPYLESELQRFSAITRDPDTKKRIETLSFKDGRDVLAMHLLRNRFRSRDMAKYTEAMWTMLVVRKLPEQRWKASVARIPPNALSLKENPSEFSDFDRSIYLLILNTLTSLLEEWAGG